MKSVMDALNPRVVIAISTLSPLRIPQNHSQTPRIYALCNDGTIWMYAEDLGWRRLPDIPQDIPQEAVNEVEELSDRHI